MALKPPPMSLALLSLHFNFCIHSMSVFLFSVKSASSLPLPVIVPTFMDHGPHSYHSSSVHPSFLPSPSLHSCSSAPPTPPPISCILTPEPWWGTVPYGVVGNPCLDRSGMALSFLIRINELADYYAGWHSQPNAPHLFELGTGTKGRWLVSPVTGFVPSGFWICSTRNLSFLRLSHIYNKNNHEFLSPFILVCVYFTTVLITCQNIAVTFAKSAQELIVTDLLVRPRSTHHAHHSPAEGTRKSPKSARKTLR